MDHLALLCECCLVVEFLCMSAWYRSFVVNNLFAIRPDLCSLSLEFSLTTSIAYELDMSGWIEDKRGLAHLPTAQCSEIATAARCRLLQRISPRRQPH